MGMELTQRIDKIGSCKTCSSPVHKFMAYIDEDGARGVTLIYRPVTTTGYWVACSNINCENHEGEGTLPYRSIEFDQFNIDA